MRVVLTIVGKDKVGITAKVSNALAEMNINIININQNIMQGFFNMVLIADMAEANVPIAEARDKMAALGEEIGRAMGEEAAAQEVAVLLGPGLNTKRSPLCGRNFEYFSEDPYLSGKLAAAYVRGIQSNGIAACPKHFAVNSQELRRMA